MKPPARMISACLFAMLCVLLFPSCTTADVKRRQAAINSAQSDILDRRAARIQARDERMNASRQVWFQ